MYFKSKLYREEIKHWALLLALTIWALLATATSLRQDKTILIALDESGTRTITDAKDKFLALELKNFIHTFLTKYYNYNELTFSEQMQSATDLMDKALWETEKEKLLSIQTKLKLEPLTQSSIIQSIDQIGESTYEAILKTTISSRLNAKTVQIKTTLELKKSPRTENNPWGYEITELHDETL